MAYADVDDIRAEGITDETAYPDARVQERLDLAHEYLHRRTRRWYEPTDGVLELDGTDHHTLHLPMPLLEITSIEVDEVALAASDLTDIKNHNGATPLRDDRFNPKLVWKGGTWPAGQANVVIDGSWGFVEADESTPLAIKRLVIDLVIWDLDARGNMAAAADRREALFATQQTTHNRSVTLSNLAISAGPTGDRAIDRALDAFAPLPRIAAVRQRPL